MLLNQRPRRRMTGIAALALAGSFAASALAASSSDDAKKPAKTHWAFVAPRRPERPPSVRNSAWVRNPIDAFILAKLDEQNISPAPEADRATLLRRLSFDLIGLPPTPEELDAFEADASPDAYEKQVDRLLASPHHGERWAQHWLDLARYADTDGFEFDQARPNAWRYRDWVVNAINSDMPYDEFVRRQIAGDELGDDPASFIATGFNRCYPDMVDLNDQALRRQNALNDITDTTSLVFLGLTIGCARCHDHKFDPLTQVDYFRLQAFFTPARFRDDFPIASARERTDYERTRHDWETEVAGLQSRLLQIEQPVRESLAPGLPPGLGDDVIAAIQKAADQRAPREVALVFDAVARDKRVSPKQLDAALGDPAKRERDGIRSQLDALVKKPPPPLPQARGMDEANSAAAPTFVLRRGEFGARGQEVSPGFPAVLSKDDPAITARAHSTGRRAALADWLVKPDHPLTRRVFVNRVWRQHFGRGIVASPSDFGVIGDDPSHPLLLDWLATEMTIKGLTPKQLHRLIVTSATYRQSSRVNSTAARLDPENALLWRRSRQRLDGEAIRDALLAVAGELNPAIGGPPVFPELPVELTRLSSKGDIWPVSPKPEDRDRRSLYVFVRRNLRFPFFEAFDRPDTNASCPQRPVTTIAPQALSLLNGKLAGDAAKKLAERVVREAGKDRGKQVERLFRLALGRRPDDAEKAFARAFLDHEPIDLLCLSLLNVNEFVYVD